MQGKSRKSVFIVDDDSDDRQLILDALRENNNTFEYILVDSAEHLLSELNNTNNNIPDLIILDLNMPGIMGLQTLKEIRTSKSLKYIPIVVLTTSTLEKDRKLSYEYGANCFLTKSYSYKKMVILAGAIINLWLLDNL